MLQLRIDSNLNGDQIGEGSIRSSFEQLAAGGGVASNTVSNKNNQLQILTMKVKDVAGVTKTRSVEALSFELHP